MTIELKITCDLCGEVATTAGFHPTHRIFDVPIKLAHEMLCYYPLSAQQHQCMVCAAKLVDKPEIG